MSQYDRLVLPGGWRSIAWFNEPPKAIIVLTEATMPKTHVERGPNHVSVFPTLLCLDVAVVARAQILLDHLWRGWRFPDYAP
ncbi:MAG: hypothetical protein C7B47_12290 [Sulfobacillus thermosulfidooxidans]|uniref:Uncharacterized protein n=1 Tax=Sulfobacillus thermosulfidooxidans TaxID=28034 RepID=A0A2T2WT60_SULTH|nr:MAG: hypothetical protein C7B47_12290 [Sulfobacillus thermosulfidooxidans]